MDSRGTIAYPASQQEQAGNTGSFGQAMLMHSADRGFAHAAIPVVNIPHAGGNPYQRLMYSAADGFVMEPGGKDAFDDLAARAAAGEPVILHLHWDDRIFGRSTDEAESQAAAERIFASLARFKAHGGRILWTIHNRRPHREMDPITWEAARHMLAEMADLVHVHAPHAAEHMSATYGVPAERLRIIPHPSYLGAYEPAETTLSRPVADSAACEFLFFGMFRGEKGVGAIHEAARKLSRREAPFHVTMAGKAFASQKRLLRRLGAVPQITLRTDRVPDAEVPALFGEAHFFLAPYSSLFTSGSVMLALTFGLPVIGPDLPELRQTLPEENHALLYPPDSPRGLIRAMMRAIEMPRTELERHRAACLEFARARAPQAVSRKLADALSELVAGGRPASILHTQAQISGG